jgi:hypothetical protein
VIPNLSSLPPPFSLSIPEYVDCVEKVTQYWLDIFASVNGENLCLAKNDPKYSTY